MKQAKTTSRKRSQTQAASRDSVSETLRGSLGEIVGAKDAKEFMAIAKKRTLKAERKAEAFLDVAMEQLADLRKFIARNQVLTALGGLGLGLLVAAGIRRAVK